MRIRLTGTIADVTEDDVVIEQDGVGWEVMVPHSTIPELASARGRTVTLHTLEFLEGNQFGGAFMPRLVGFLQPRDKDFFLKFIEVKGIGIRKALRALEMPTATVARWIEEGNAKSLATLPGIGKRSAELIVAQLRGKLADLAIGGVSAVDEERTSLSREQRDALEVLVAWGDPRHDAERWLRQAGERHPELRGTDDWVRAAYRVKTGTEG